MTERIGKRLIRVNPETGASKTAYEFDIPDVIEGAQTGVMGFAFHPDFGKGADQIFVDPTRRMRPTPTTACSRRSSGSTGMRPAKQ